MRHVQLISEDFDQLHRDVLFTEFADFRLLCALFLLKRVQFAVHVGYLTLFPLRQPLVLTGFSLAFGVVHDLFYCSVVLLLHLARKLLR